MLILLSPAKSLDFEKKVKIFSFSVPRLLAESEKLILLAQELRTTDLIRLMKISETIANLNVLRFAQFTTPFTEENAKPAIFAFTGNVYQGLNVANWTREDLQFAQNKLRILSGLYGVLRPLDLIQAYRLEMGTALENEKGRNLYDFWRDKIATELNKDIAPNDFVINLASDEYFKAVNTKQLNARVIHIEFREFKNKDYKIVAPFAKKARGLMASYLIKGRVEDMEGIKRFNEANYVFSKQFSSETKLVFVR